MTIPFSSTIVVFLLGALCSSISTVVRAQGSTTNGGENYQYPYARFSPSLAVIIVVLIAALFFVGFFAIYFRHCSSNSSGGTRRGASARGRAAAAARGLDASVIEGFPTFSYAEVKDHKIGKGVLECAVCLSEFQDEDTLRLLPKCDHVFHPQCIDAWLESHVTCPVCRANLGEENPRPATESTPESDVIGESVDRSGEERDVVIQIGDESQGNDDGPSKLGDKSSSVKRPKRMFSLTKFRSHSTGHDSVVQPGDNLDRFTLRLPAGVRKEVMDRASLNRTKSFAATGLPRMGSSRRGYRAAGAGEGSSRAGRFSRRSDGSARSDRWVSFARAFSMRSPRVVAENGGEGSSVSGGVGRPLVNMRSFNCLESRVKDGDDEERLVSGKPGRSEPV